MRILIAHSWLLVMSGDNRVVEDEAELLRQAGHDARTWTPSAEGVHGVGMAAAGARAVWSRQAARELRRRIREQGADVVHLHNLYPNLTPTVIRAAAAEDVPVVMTLHSYRLASCLPASFLRDGQVCEDCLGRVPWRGVIHRCYRDSFVGSAVMATSMTLHRAARSYDGVSRFLAVSSFVRAKHVEAGIPSDRISVKPNFAWPAEPRATFGGSFVYVGRLHVEKGVDTLIEAWRTAPGSLVVVGGGPEADRLRAGAPGDVEFTGQVPAARVDTLIRGCRALLVPSRWYEAAPRAILEAFARGVPVVASDLGALPELVQDGVNGLLVPPDDPPAWAEAARRLQNDDLVRRLGEGARRAWAERFTPKHGLKGLESAYWSVARTRGPSDP
jgi:glycosyltransferase involved in cell wall biosynthesis